jgi:hypothetical protein
MKFTNLKRIPTLFNVIVSCLLICFLLFFFVLLILVFFFRIKYYPANWIPSFSCTFAFFHTIVSIETFVDYLTWSAKVECVASLPAFDERGNFGFIYIIDAPPPPRRFLLTFLLLMIAFILVVDINNLFTKKSMFESLKKKKIVNWFFLLEKKNQRLVVTIFIGIILLSFYWLFSSNLFPTIWCKVLQWLSIGAYCTDDGISRNPASSKQSSCKNEEKSTAGKKSRSSTKASQSSTKPEQSSEKSTKSDTKTETFSSTTASPSSSKGKGKASTSSKKNKPSKKAIDAVKQAEQVTKTEASKAAKGRKQSSSSGRPVRPEDLWGDDKLLASQLKNAKMLNEKGKQAKQDSVDYFPDLENAKGVSKNQITDIEWGESSQVKPSQTKHIRYMEGKTAFELGTNFGKIRRDSYIFKDDK